MTSKTVFHIRLCISHFRAVSAKEYKVTVNIWQKLNENVLSMYKFYFLPYSKEEVSLRIKEIPAVLYQVFTTGRRQKLFINRTVKDRLFRFIFSKDPAALLQLYNALNGTDYEDADALEIVTLDNIVYMSMKNDLAFIVTGVLNLYEHQSTINPNMPLRCFLYLGQEYQKIVTKRHNNIYGTSLIKLPTPKCVVFYNGDRAKPDEEILRLSDAYQNTEMEPDVELRVRVLNINYGHNEKIMEKCRRLKEYAYFVHQINYNLKLGTPLSDAVDQAVVYCIENDIMADILEQHRTEVMGMLLTEYNERKTMRYLRKEAREEGIEKGIETAIRISKSLHATYEQTLVHLIEESSLTEEQAKAYMQKYWS